MGTSTLTDSQLRDARRRLVQMHYKARVGHLGGNLSALDATLLVFHEFMQDGDEFVLSKGHGAGALYTALWSKGLLSDADLDTFHQDGTLLGGHPPAGGIDAIPFATGSLGHGLSLAAGLAFGWKLQKKPSRAYCLTSDGEWQEGSTWEALIFACHHKLANLTILVDCNGLQGFGTTAEVASMDGLPAKLAGFDATLTVVDGHDLQAMRQVLSEPAPGVRIVILKTVKGHGVSFMQNRMEWHYLPLSESQYQTALAEIEAA